MRDREHALSPERAAEIDATLDLVAAAMQGHELTNTEAAFVLPSAMNAAQVAELTGQTS
jgi:hydrogenase expression/formation protein HypC